MKRNNKQGFSLAEMLLVTAITVILAAVAFIAVFAYQRSLHQVEYDNYAKELFISAQNHLTMADSQGLVKKMSDSESGLSVTYTKKSGAAQNSGVYCLVTGSSDDVLTLMLPANSFATGQSGNYMIVYQKSTATVLEVFYSPRQGDRYGHNYKTDEYQAMMDLRGDDHKADRRDYNGAILGYYGGGEGIEVIRLKEPTVTVQNGNTLSVKVTNPNTDESVKSHVTLQLIVTGKTSGAVKTISLIDKGVIGDLTVYMTGVPSPAGNEFNLEFDDITTKNGRFAKRFENADTGSFIPGEDLEIQAKAFSSNAYANVAMSNIATTNSLFADPTPYLAGQAVLGSSVGNGVAGIASFRHLENLDARVSQLDKNDDNKLNIVKAAQIKDLDWDDFGSGRKIYQYTNDTTDTGCYLPVNPSHFVSDAVSRAFEYDGQNHYVSDVKVAYSGDAGLFGSFGIAGSASSIKNLELRDFSVSGTSSAGALAGSVRNCTVTNVLAREKDSSGKIITASSGNAGGLIGSVTDSTVEKSAAAVIVRSTGANAGGLIGSMSGGSVSASYAGGHTNKAKYYTDSGDPIYNVSANAASGAAGGLIGSMNGGSVTNSYSTCSASGATAGGLVGSGSGSVSVSNSYCTGLVSGTSEGAFAGSFSGSLSGQYMEIINERLDTEAGFIYLPAVGNGTFDGITRIDENANTYNTFCGSRTNWKDANPYDATLSSIYSGKYNLRTVSQLDSGAGSTGFVVATHYGDWPAPEVFVINN